MAGMEQTGVAEIQPPKKRRPTAFGRAARAKRIFARLREGWAYDEVAREERLSPQRVRQIVSEVLDKRIVDRGQDYAQLQVVRLAPALRVASEALNGGDVKAIGPFLKVLKQLDTYQVTLIAKYTYGPEEREKLLNKLNVIAARLKDDPEDAPAVAAGVEAGETVSEARGTGAAVDDRRSLW
jgi:hypothetical protein